MSDIGTWAWAQRTGGAMSRRDELDQWRQIISMRLAAVPARFRSQGIVADKSLELPDPPDSKFARSAEECAREASSPELYGHCVRTWMFAAAFGELDSVKYDPELLYTACLLHDLGLTPSHEAEDQKVACFAVVGGRSARQHLVGEGMPDQRADRVAEAITLHLNVTVGQDMAAEALLLGKGVSLDAVGRHKAELPPQTVSDVTTRWPRTGFAEQLAASTRRQARIRPKSRSAFLGRLGFSDLVTGNPLDNNIEGAP